MKRLMNLVALATLSTNTIPTFNLVLNTSVFKNLSLNHNLTSVNNDDFKTKFTGTSGVINAVVADNNGNIYAGSSDGKIYKSNGTNLFTKSIELNINILELATDEYGNIYAVGDSTIYKIHLLNNLITSNQPDYFGLKYSGFVYKQQQAITLKPDYLKSATLDGFPVDVSATEPITVGKHTLSLTLNNKNNCNQYLDLFGGNTSTGVITYNFWVKNAIDPTTKFNYSTITHDTDLLTGLISNAGNTKDSAIIQTRQIGSSGVVTLNTQITSKMIDLSKSYYVTGTVDSQINNFSESGSRQIVPTNLSITTDGIYHLHLVDMVGNTYDNYLELGKNNWQLKGDFDDFTLKKLETQLNVNVSVSSPIDKQIAMGWLQNYQRDVASALITAVQTYGKGFPISIDKDKYKDFCNPVTYTSSATKEKV